MGEVIGIVGIEGVFSARHDQPRVLAPGTTIVMGCWFLPSSNSLRVSFRGEFDEPSG
jgi:hypothetical protein